MRLQDKGERNLEIAEVLDSQEFLKLLNPPTKADKEFCKKHLCSVIINRLYYGVYLLGKDKLLTKDGSITESHFLGHGTEKIIKDIRNNDEAKESKYLWVRLKGVYSDEKGIYRMCVEAARLHEVRNCYDYCSDVEENEALKDLEASKKRAKFVAEKVRSLQ